jgi:hypothetical protein
VSLQMLNAHNKSAILMKTELWNYFSTSLQEKKDSNPRGGQVLPRTHTAAKAKRIHFQVVAYLALRSDPPLWIEAIRFRENGRVTTDGPM